MFKKILIANRGEVALRILRACRELGIETVMVHSTTDSESMPVCLADESVCIGPGPSAQSYLNIPAILAAAEITGAEAIHPGFGFLSENAHFSSTVQDHGLVFIGPDPQHIDVMGHKVKAKQTAQELGLDVVMGSGAELEGLDQAMDLARQIGYPVLLKASMGGGGKGMRIVYREEDLQEHMSQAQAEAMASFGHGGLYMEKFLIKPRHIEFQIIADHHGHVVCLGERDCSIQRRHQKIWEEAPSCGISHAQREEMTARIVKAMEVFGYRNAGTLEFLYEEGRFYFIEMNTRLQVEHPITEMITGIDIVKEQIRVAAGLPLSFTQNDIVLRGHAIECRINAENSETFTPSPGRVQSYLAPGGPFVRVDSALFAGYTIPPYYDSLISKLVVHGNTREECMARLRRALQEYVITGVDTLIPLHQALCDLEDIKKGEFHIKWLEQEGLKAIYPSQGDAS